MRWSRLSSAALLAAFFAMPAPSGAQLLRVAGQIESTTTTEAPLKVASTDVVDNLNADLLDGMEASDFSIAGPTSVTVNVDCSTESISDALSTPAQNLTIEFTGTCVEDVEILRGNTTLRGLDASRAATIQGAVRNFASATPGQGTDGPIFLENLTVTMSSDNGITVSHGSLYAEDVTASSNTSDGIVAYSNAFARLHNVTADDNGADGVQITGGSQGELSGTIDLTDNTENGIAVSLSASALLQETSLGTTASLTATGNVVGVRVTTGASLLAPPGSIITSSSNDDFGLYVTTNGSFVNFGTITANLNDSGLVVSTAGDVTATSGSLTLEDNTIYGALVFIGGSLFWDTTATIESNPAGLRVDQGSAYIDHATFTTNTTDLDLDFASETTIGGSSTVAGTITCDASALLRGATCP